jgi:hypothetical protein
MTKLSLAACLLALLPLAPQETAAESVRGITVSTPGMGRDWGSDAMVETLRDIQSVGGNWVTIHPYAGIGDGKGRGGLEEGEIRGWNGLGDEAPPTHLTRPIREAQALGLKILVKPHLAYWGTRFNWRGDIHFDTEESYQLFFNSYETWITQMAATCKNADAFVVGTELDQTLSHEKEWRRIIASIRKVTDVPLTYAANWDTYQKVNFWDDLDVIGIQAYFPITEEPCDDHDQLRAGWERVMEELRTFGDTTNRRVVFTELGYNHTTKAAVRPWDYATEKGIEAEATQEACMRVALEAIEAEPVVVGSFLWKWFPSKRSTPRDFNMRSPRILQVLRETWPVEAKGQETR